MALSPSPKPPVEERVNTLLDDGRPVGTIHHKGEHLPTSAHGPPVGGRRDHGGSGKPLGPAPLHWGWPDARVEGYLWRRGRLFRLLCASSWLWSWPRYRLTHPWEGDLWGQTRGSEEVPICWGLCLPLSQPYNCGSRAQLISLFFQEALPDSPKVWDGGPHRGSHLHHH